MLISKAEQMHIPALLSRFPIYLGFARNAFLKMLAYRLRYYTGILTYVLLTSVHYFIWQAIFAGKPPGTEVNGFTLEDMITYVSIGWLARTFYHSNIDHEIDDLVRTGQIGTFLIRPVNFQFVMIAQAAGEAFFRIGLFTAPVGLAIWLLFPVSPPESFIYLLLFLAATALGFLILAEFNFLVGLIAFSFKSIQGVMRAKYYIVQLCSGLILPMVFFPDAFRAVLELLPFQAVAYLPLRFYLGQISGNEIVQAFLAQFFWIAVLFFLGRYFWDKACARLTFQGG